MKKRLLFAALAMLSAVATYAVEEGEYLYTASGRVKVTGENLIENGNFLEGLAEGGWKSTAADGLVNQSVFLIKDGEGPNGEAIVESQAATADENLCNVWQLTSGSTYVVSFQVKGAEVGKSSVGTTIGNNYMDFFQNYDGALTHAAEATSIATAIDITTEWTTVAFSFTAGETVDGNEPMLVMHFEKLFTGLQIANISLNEVDVVSDDRPIRKQVEWIQTLLNDPNFNTADAAEARGSVEEEVEYVLDGLDNGDLDDPSEAESAVEGMITTFEEFMDVTSENLLLENTMFPNVADITKVAKYNRGGISNGQVIGGFKFYGDNWLHAQGAAVLAKQIQGTFNNGAGAIALYNSKLPAGKYFISAEMNNGYCDSKYNITYTLESNVKAFIGKDTVDMGTIVGKDYQRFYMIAEFDGETPFEAGFWWGGPSTGSRFEITNFECRSFGNVADEVARKEAWDKFLTQWNAAVAAREKVIAMQSDANYPWAKDTLQRALDQWDPLFNAQVAKNWIDADGKDTRVATTEELEAFATTTGIVGMEAPYDKYALVRCYQYASNYVIAQNKVFADLQSEIENAKVILNDDMNALGDKTTFNAAIKTAQDLHDAKLASTSDATMAADSLELANGIVTLQTAEETFKASVPELTPIIDIDFSQAATEVLDDAQVLTAYSIKGAKGEMLIPSSVWNQTGDDGADAFVFDQGYKGEQTEVLRIGNGEATVNIPEADLPTEDDVIRVSFDCWFGRLTKNYFRFDLRDAEGNRVAGFRFQPYDGTLDYNDFDNAEGTGMKLVSGTSFVASTTGNVGHLVDANKTSFDLIVDLKACTLQGIATIPNGTKIGSVVAIPTENMIVSQIVVGSDYNYAEARRCWFDNLKVLKYASTAEGPDPVTSIETVKASATAPVAIYSLSGVKMNGKNLQKGLYIINGKKYIVK